ncbi:MAG: DUF3833 family protein [Pseudomonadota bacterium]
MTGFLLFSLGVLVALAAFWGFNRWLGFGAQMPTDYAGQGPDLDIRAVLNGPLICEGVIYGPIGRVNARFVADFDASWSGNEGVMKEHFLYDSGTRQDREWRLTWLENGQVRAEADDLVGPGTGVQEGPSLKLSYRIRLPKESGGHVLDVTDWMYLVENGTVINRSQFRKFGVKVAELVAVMRPNETRVMQTMKDAA